MPRNQTAAGRSVEDGAKGVRGRGDAARVGMHKGSKGVKADRINRGRKIY